MIFHLVENKSRTRYRCNVCGGYTGKIPIICESEEGIRVCETCLEEQNFDDRLRARIDGLTEYVAVLHCLIGHINAPTLQEWKQRVDEYDDYVPF